MKKTSVANGEIAASEIALGCMRIAALSDKDAARLISTALEEGINFFDNADVYAGGKSEEVFAKALKQSSVGREKVIIQSKCGIVKTPASSPDGQRVYFDFSKEHILEAVENSLKRLGTDYLDILLLHRPDALVEPEEVAEAFTQLHSSGKVRYFGVSNQNPMQIELLSRYLNHPIMFNQLQLSLMFTGMIDAGFNVNMKIDPSVNRDGSILDYCRLKGITIQAWSPFQFGYFGGVFLNNELFPELNKEIDAIAQARGVPNSAVAAAWILRHPARIQTVAGTTNAARLRDICRASEVELTRQEWYGLYLAAGNKLP